MTDHDRMQIAMLRNAPKRIADAEHTTVVRWLCNLAEREAARADAAEAVVVALCDAIGRTAREAAGGPAAP